MVTYYNQNDMEQYASWVAKTRFPLPKNWGVVVQDAQFSKTMERHLQKWHGSFELKIRENEQKNIIRDLRKMINEYNIALVESSCHPPVCWFGRVGEDKNRFRSGSHSFLIENNMLSPDGFEIQIITMDHFMLHFIGADGDSIENWIQSRRGIMSK